jgi:uncharacterized membrane protein
VAVQPNTTGYLIRTTNLPSNATGWAVCFWFRRTGAVGTGVVETLFEIVDDGDGDYAKVYVNDAGELHFQGINDFEDVNVFTPTLNTWYFFALRTTSATAGDLVYRAETATSFTSSTGRKFQTDGGWDRMVFLNNSGLLEPAAHFEAFCLKAFIGTLSDAQLWEQSVRMLPKAQGTALDSYVPLYTNSGADEGGRARDWTITGTLAAVATQPRGVTRGGPPGARLFIPAAAAGNTSTIAATLPNLTAAATFQQTNPCTVAATLPGLTAAAAFQQTNAATIAGTLPGLTAAAAFQQTNPATIAATLPGLTAAALMASTVGSIAGVLPGLTAAATFQQTNPAAIAATLAGLTAAALFSQTNVSSVAATLPGLVAALNMTSGTPAPPSTGRRPKDRDRSRDRGLRRRC